ncbi:uncharacterized protein LOC133185384 [Saccostrea echinata]|uniref:uncharacterized protein LOC133185384 n=1 Tax=Saccostrea echinata TaxID=191078 RepID=UPI002A7EF859|nr:uncharacterized protein LOC133185384 [Saccostrea echinata]XP_061176532.1 uncharacterized protein LOC133185384 [Saccostrea echinata]
MPPGGGDDINLLDIPRKKGEMDDEDEKERQSQVRAFQERINKGGKPLNIAFIGPAGSGKSSLCNSIMATFCVNGWRERATVGHFGGHAEQVTHHLLSFPKVEYLDFDALYDYNYPTLVDMNGFENNCDELTEELLRIVFFGRLPNEEKLMDAVKISKQKGIEGLRDHYSKNHEDLKIDRIIFVASAKSELPTRLMEAVRKTALKEGRVIPIFGILTHRDEVDREDADYIKLETDFRHGLGFSENRFLLCTTYCDAYDKYVGKSRLDHRHPELDIPILKFMRQVCDPALKVIKDKTTYNQEEPLTPPTPGTERQQSEVQAKQREDQKLIKMCIKGGAIAVFVWIILPFIYSYRDIANICTQHSYGGCKFRDLTTFCDERSSMHVWRIIFSLLFAAFTMGLDFLCEKFDLPT